MAKGQKQSKAKPEVQPEVVDQTAPEINPATEKDTRKPFSIPTRYRIRFDGKKGLIVAGYSKVPVDGHYPHFSCYRIARALGINLKDYEQCDERHQEIIEAAREAGLEVVTVDSLRAAEESPVAESTEESPVAESTEESPVAESTEESPAEEPHG